MSIKYGAAPRSVSTVTICCRFDEIKDEASLMGFFEKHYPDSIALIGRERLCKDYFSNKPSMLISIKASDLNGK